MRTVLYARYSSHLQNSRSIDDQIAILRARADQERWEIVEVFTDYAISGAAGIDETARPGLNAMLARVEAGGIDQVLAEATDRIARHQGDAFSIRERILYAGARLFTLSDGEVTEYTAAFKGLMDAQFRKELGAKIKRGQRGAISSGRAPAGLAYGYRKANTLDAHGNLIRGLREIDEDQAAIVTKIFEQYAANVSPRRIAEELNEARVPGPSGGKWRASTIAGDRVRQNGMLQNRLYAGVLVHNRTSKIVDPKSRKIRIRPNPENDWISEPAPHLRIVSDELWTQVSERRCRYDGISHRLQRRPKHLLSGLAFCGVCGGGWTVIGLERWGCGRHRDGGGCTNNRSIRSDIMEARVLEGLRAKMLDPDAVALFVKEYHADRGRRARDAARERGSLERRHAEAHRKIMQFVDAIGDGAKKFGEVKSAMFEARATRDAMAAQLRDLDALPIVTLHPGIAEDYRRQVADIAKALNSNPDAQLEAIPKLRSLIDRVIVTPGERSRTVEIELTGKLASIIALATGKPVPEELMFVMERVKGIEPSS